MRIRILASWSVFPGPETLFWERISRRLRVSLLVPTAISLRSWTRIWWTWVSPVKDWSINACGSSNLTILRGTERPSSTPREPSSWSGTLWTASPVYSTWSVPDPITNPSVTTTSNSSHSFGRNSSNRISPSGKTFTISGSMRRSRFTSLDMMMSSTTLSQLSASSSSSFWTKTTCQAQKSNNICRWPSRRHLHRFTSHVLGKSMATWTNSTKYN